MEILQHILGACGDNHAHLDLTDIVYAGGALGGLYSVKYYIKGIILILKEKLWKF